MENQLLLKKYSNRRLYDTEKSVYVTLDLVAGIIRQGRQIKVEDAKTGEDVTASILTQIVLEESRKKNYLLPTPLLYLIIQYGENVLSDFFEKYLEQTIKNYLLLRNLADDQFKNWLDYGEQFAQSNRPKIPSLPSLFDLFSQNKQKPKEDKQ
jgi:polyhydroxyalkanoate synthesis repressor PhaR